jgi:hypothetical protein
LNFPEGVTVIETLSGSTVTYRRVRVNACGCILTFETRPEMVWGSLTGAREPEGPATGIELLEEEWRVAVRTHVCLKDAE